MTRMQILCYGDSNTWGYDAETGGRFDDDTRWTMQLQKLLGERYNIIEEGLCGRTSVFDDPLNEGLNGFTALVPVFLSHGPLDLAVIMLGTNDCKERFSANPQNIAAGLKRLIVKAKELPVWKKLPAVLICAPLKMRKELYSVPGIREEMGAGCVEKSQELPELFKNTASAAGCGFFDCNMYATPDRFDYMHFSTDSNEKIAQALKVYISQGVLL